MAKGMDREDFQGLMNSTTKLSHQVLYKSDFSAEQMRELALNYQQAVRERGFGMPEDPWLQLIGSVDMVLDSWNTPKAREYRHLMGCFRRLGDGSHRAGHGLRQLESDRPAAACSSPPIPIARSGGSPSGVIMPPVTRGRILFPAWSPVILFRWSRRKWTAGTGRRAWSDVFRKFTSGCSASAVIWSTTKEWNPQEIEFTFEGPDPEQLYILQTRDMITIKKKEHLNVFADSDRGALRIDSWQGYRGLRFGNVRQGGVQRGQYSRSCGGAIHRPSSSSSVRTRYPRISGRSQWPTDW